MKSVYLKISSLFVLVFTLLVFNHCVSRPKVSIRYDNYKPGFSPAKYSEYKGKYVFLAEFMNQAENTSIYSYFNQDKSYVYETQNLADYFWYCFQKTFKSIGSRVQEGLTNINPKTPELQMTLLSVTDEKVLFKMQVYIQQVMEFDKDFSLRFNPADTQDLEIREKQAYEMTDQIIMAVLDDPKFKELVVEGIKL